MVLSMDETETLVAVSRMLREIEARVVAKLQAEQGETKMNSLKLTVGRAKEMTVNMGPRWPVKDQNGATIKTTRTRDEARKFILDELELARSPEATS